MKWYCLTFFTLLIGLPAASPAGILGWERLSIDFANPKDAAAKTAWSEPERIGVTDAGLGSLYGGQRISRFEADASFGLNGMSHEPNDLAAQPDFGVPWRFRGP